MNILGLIEKVKAQGADTLASPTFPFTPPGGTPATPTTPSTGRNILLQTDTTSIKAQEKFTVRIYIDTNETEISGFTANISFDPDYFQVVDADSDTTGIQIDYLDTTFDAVINSANNTSGIINLRAETEANQATSLSRTVAEIEFRAIKTGASEIEITQSSSNIISTSGVDVLDNVNSLSFNISAHTEEIIPTSSTTSHELIPKTGISDNINLLAASIGGLLLIITGIYIRKLSKRESKHTNAAD